MVLAIMIVSGILILILIVIVMYLIVKLVLEIFKRMAELSEPSDITDEEREKIYKYPPIINRDEPTDD